MSNLQSILGGAAWTAVATLMMLAALEPAPAVASDAQFAAVKIAAGYAEA